MTVLMVASGFLLVLCTGGNDGCILIGGMILGATLFGRGAL